MKSIERKGSRLKNFLRVIRVRSKVRRLLGKSAWQKVRQIQVVTWPSSLNDQPKIFSSNDYVLEKILLVLGIKPKGFSPHHNPHNTVFINWQDLTYDKANFERYIEESYKEKSKHMKYNEAFLGAVRINAGCNDISKRRVAECFEQVFGYSLDVNPLTYKGKMVVKSDYNATHDGREIMGPITKSDLDKNCVYNICIDNSEDSESVVDYRVLFIGGVARFCYRKMRPQHIRFSTTNTSVSLHKTKEIFSENEIKKINHFCKLMGLDYGEIDCLRGRNSKKLYIIDVNKTQAGPPNGAKKSDKMSAIVDMSVLFARNFLLKKGRRTS